MKKNVSLILMIFLGFIVLSNISSCDDEFAVTDPPYGIYKTNHDYFHFFAPSTKKSGEVAVTPYFINDDPRIYIMENDTVFALRVALDEGYVLSGEVYPDAPFTDATYKECLRRQGTNSPVTAVLLDQRIIDRDPFLEYYEIDTEFVTKYFSQFLNLGYSSGKVRNLAFQEAAKEINIIIVEGRLEDEFRKIK